MELRGMRRRGFQSRVSGGTAPSLQGVYRSGLTLRMRAQGLEELGSAVY